MSSETPSSIFEAVIKMPSGPLFEKSENVLWAFTPTGIVLHNFERGLFVELEGLGERTWAYMDGTNHLKEVVAALAGQQFGTREELDEKVRNLALELLIAGFLVERSA